MCSRSIHSRMTRMGLVPLALASLLASVPAQAVTFELCAKAGTVTMPDGTLVNIWAFVTNTSTDCSTEVATLPGPELVVPVNASVTVNLTNTLPEAVSIVFPGQNLIPDTTGVPNGGTASYTFTASNPGTFLYQTGTNTGAQNLMGLYGALIVRPAAAGQAYNNGGSAFDQEQVLVLSELDPVLNGLIGAGTFGTGTPCPPPQDPQLPAGCIKTLLHYAPKYWLINGKAYDPGPPATVGPATLPIPVTGLRLLLRYVNAGSDHQAMTLVGMHQRLIARDHDPLAFPYDVVAETIPAGQTTDTIAALPPGTTVGKQFPLYNRNLRVTNAASFPGGMLAILEAGVGGPSPPAVNHPPVFTSTCPTAATEGVAYAPPSGCDVNATDPDAGQTLTFSLDTFPAGMTINGGTGIINWTPGFLQGGNHTVTVRVTDNGSPVNKFATQTFTITVTAVNAKLYLSLLNGGSYSVGAVAGVANEDILRLNTANQFAMFFDGSDVGVGALDVDAFQIVDADTIRMSFSAPGTVPGIGTVDDSDVVQFDATTLGLNTSGTFTLFFSGAAAGLTTSNEDVDAIELLPDGRLLISTIGPATVPGIGSPAPQDEDLLAFTPATAGNYLAGGTFAYYFDGSDVGLATNDGEDLDAAAVSGTSIYLSTLSNFSVTGVSGADEDVFVCGSAGTGPTTTCAYSSTLFFDGSAFGLGANDVDAIDVP